MAKKRAVEKQAAAYFTLRLPELTTRRVWVGCYSDMTGTVVMIFEGEPTRDDDDPIGKFTVLNERYAASIWLDDWEHWFGTVQPFVAAGLVELRHLPGGDMYVSIPELDCTRVIPIDLTAAWNADGEIVGLDVQADN